jgi:high-affinity nickel-transport protein
MEMSVAVMLIVLGVMNVGGTLSKIRRIAHGHDHDHAPLDEGSEAPLRASSGLRPLVIGVVHGLAGSAAIALLVLATINSAERALLYLAVFGAGTLAGMMLLTLAMSLPISALAQRFPNVEQPLARFTGLISIALGLFLAYRIGIVDGLLFGAPAWVPH